MLKDFKRDLEAAKQAEQIALEVLSGYYAGWQLEDVSDNRSCFYLGDLKATTTSGAVKYIEVKDDSRIADTQNILCEEENYIKDSNSFIRGNMSSQGDIYCIVS